MIMVVIEVKKADGDSFLYETTCSALNDDMVRDVVEIHNLRVRLQQLCGGIRELGRHGPMKPPDQAGLDAVAEEYQGAQIAKNEYYNADPTGVRTGNGPGPQLVDVIERVAVDAENAISKNNALRKLATSKQFLQEKLDNIRGAVVMAYPIGPP